MSGVAMTPQEARAIAALLYHGRLDWSSEPEFGHLKRVAAGARHLGVDAVACGWLHDAVEDGLTTFGALKEVGLSDTQYKTLFLLTRMPEETYLDYIRCIAAADGLAGEWAVGIKLLDNEDNCTRPCPADKLGMRQPGGRYDKARKILLGEHH